MYNSIQFVVLIYVTGCLELTWKDAVDMHTSDVQAAFTVTSLTVKYEQVRRALDLPPPFFVQGLAESTIEKHAAGGACWPLLEAGDYLMPLDYSCLFQQVLE